jgi:NADP-dependent 3-hydroxy acid dehydrogenase YdfG
VEAIARAILFAIAQPDEVDVSEITISKYTRTSQI